MMRTIILQMNSRLVIQTQLDIEESINDMGLNIIITMLSSNNT
jgi:hypothetical protein